MDQKKKRLPQLFQPTPIRIHNASPHENKAQVGGTSSQNYTPPLEFPAIDHLRPKSFSTFDIG
jgi:hypothetical protein